MRATLALLTMGAGLLASTACASTVSTSAGSSAAQSFIANGVPMPSATGIPRAIPGPKPRAWMRAGKGSGSLVYVAAYNQVAVFLEGGNQQAMGSITDGVANAWGLFVDGRRDLYVANQEGSVSAYRPGALHPFIVYSDPGKPLYAVLDHGGRLYAANRDGTVTEYPPHQTTPDITLKTPGVEADGINLDAADNLYVAYRDGSGHGSIEEFAPKSTNGRVLGMQLTEPQGVQLDRLGDIYAVETGPKQVVDIFSPGSTLPSQVLNVQDGVTQIVLRESEKRIYISNFINDNVYISDVPPHVFRQKIITGVGDVQGMALSNEER